VLAAKKLSKGFSMVRLVLFALLSASHLIPAHAEQSAVQFCWCLGKYDNTVYFAEVENREDRQTSFKELIEISGIDHYVVECRISDPASHRLLRQQILRNWLESELETVNTTFLSDLDY
jgi:hypothetical protein